MSPLCRGAIWVKCCWLWFHITTQKQPVRIRNMVYRYMNICKYHTPGHAIAIHARVRTRVLQYSEYSSTIHVRTRVRQQRCTKASRRTSTATNRTSSPSSSRREGGWAWPVDGRLASEEAAEPAQDGAVGGAPARCSTGGRSISVRPCGPSRGLWSGSRATCWHRSRTSSTRRTARWRGLGLLSWVFFFSSSSG